MNMNDRAALIEMTTEIVSAYVGNNQVDSESLTELIKRTYETLASIETDASYDTVNRVKPAIEVKDSVTDDYIVCLEDGKRFKSLKRHLRTHYDLSPSDYRAKWGLPADYPMVAPSYAKARSKLAKEMGLGHGKTSRKG